MENNNEEITKDSIFERNKSKFYPKVSIFMATSIIIVPFLDSDHE